MSTFLTNDLETALARVIQDRLAESDLENMPNVYPGKSAGDKEAPCVVGSVDGPDLEDDPPGSGNFWFNGKITLRTNAVDKSESTAMARALFEAVARWDLPELLNAAAVELGLELTAFPNSVSFLSPTSGVDELGVWVDEIPFKIYACAGRLS